MGRPPPLQGPLLLAPRSQRLRSGGCGMKRKHVSLKTKLAAALLKMLKADDAGVLRPVIPFDEAKTLTADQIISRFHFNHHPIPHAHGGPDEPWNLDPEPVEHHREITAKIDIPRI